MTDRLETENLILRKARQEDLQDIWHNVWEDVRLAENMLWTVTRTQQEAEERIRRTTALQAQIPAFFVCRKEDDVPIGFAGVKEVEPGVYEDCGICIAVPWQNHGFGKEVTKALMSLVFDQLDGHTFIYGCMRRNTRSAAVCRALGFVYAYSLEEVREWDGMPFTSDFYAMTKEEYRRLYGQSS